MPWTKTPYVIHIYCGVLPLNRVVFPTSAASLVCPTKARRVFQRGQHIQSLPKDRCFLLQNCGNPISECPPTVYTDLNGLRLLAEWHEVNR
jgi:hypothetical protein